MEKCNAEAIKNLRDAADWIEQHPELPPLYCGNIGVFLTYGREDVRKDAVVIARAMGKAEKSYSDSSIVLRKEFGDASIAWVGDRELVCERTQVGTRTVPAQPATPEREEPVYEWKCGSVLQAALDSGKDALPEPTPALIGEVVGGEA